MDEQDKVVSVFDFKGHDVRVLAVEGEPWFVAADVARVLEFSETAAMTRYLDDDESMSVKLTGMNMLSTLINEPGLYSAILRSRKSEAKEFKRWVAHEVLPSIRKHGVYMTPETIEKTLSDPDFIIGLATRLKEERQARVVAEQKLAIAEPKAEKHDKFIDASSLQGIKEVGKVFGVGEKKFFEFLRQVKILDGKNLPMQDYLNRGWFEVKESTIECGDEEDKSFNVAVTKVTAAGISALSDVVEKYGGAKILNDLKVKEVAGYVKARQLEK